MIHWLPWLLVCLCAGIIHFFPQGFTILFMINIWGISMPHTFSTFTRQDLKRKDVVIKAFLLFMLFLGLLKLVHAQLGFVFIYSLYFYWQQFHYTKQNLGIGIWNKQERTQRERLIDISFYFLVTIISLMGSFYGGSVQFFGHLLMNPFYMNLSVTTALIVNVSLLVGYIGLRSQYWKMALTHVLIFSVAYLYVDNFALGWLLINILHNAQYLLFMNRFEKNVQFIFYAALLSFAFYFFIQLGVLFSISILLMLSLNFTHYFFDGFIWKRKFNRSVYS